MHLHHLVSAHRQTVSLAAKDVWLSFSDNVTDKLNRLESFIENSLLYLFPVKIASWTLLFIALILTNMLALIYWPFSAIAKLTRSEKTSSNQIIDISSEYELRKLVAKHDHVLVDFWAEWCGPCLLMNSAIESVSSKYSSEVVEIGRAHV